MLWLGVMVLLILWLLGYGFRVGGSAIHLLLAAIAVLFLIPLLRSRARRPRRRKLPSQPLQGRIKWFNAEKQWGFIECEDGIDVFFHSSSVDSLEKEALHEGDMVEFTLDELEASVAKQVVPIKVLRHWA